MILNTDSFFIQCYNKLLDTDVSVILFLIEMRLKIFGKKKKFLYDIFAMLHSGKRRVGKVAPVSHIYTLTRGWVLVAKTNISTRFYRHNAFKALKNMVDINWILTLIFIDRNILRVFLRISISFTAELSEIDINHREILTKRTCEVI